MRSFTTDKQLNVTTDRANAALLFEHIETYADGYRVQVQAMNESGKWGGRGFDDEFTIRAKTQTPAVVLKHYRQVLEELDGNDNV